MGELVPLSEAIKQVAEVFDLPESKIAEYARRAKEMGALGNPMLSAGAVVAVGNARAVRAAMEAEQAGIRAERGRITFNGQDISPYVRSVQLCGSIPYNPANRRTFWLAGKPYHYIQLATGRLQSQPGESPWI